MVLDAGTPAKQITVQMAEQHVILNGDVIAKIAQHDAVVVVNHAGDLIQQQASG